MKYTKDEILNDLQSVAIDLNQDTITSKDYRKHGKYSEYAVCKLFGSVKQALESAGLKRSRKISREDLLIDLAATIKKSGQDSVTVDFYNKHGKYCALVVIKEFGTWNQALETLGYDPNLKQNISDKDVLEDIRRVAHQLNQTCLKVSDYREYGEFSIGPLIRHFGSVTNAFKAAKLKEYVRDFASLSEQEILDDINRVARDLNKDSLCVDEYDKNGHYSISTLANYFGTITSAFAAAGLGAFENKVSANAILDDLKNVAFNVLGKDNLNSREYDKYGKYSSSTIVHRFGKFSRALNIAGIKPNNVKARKYTDEQLIAFLRLFHNKFGHVPTRRDMEQIPGFPSDKAYYYRFPALTWAGILQKAGLVSKHQHLGLDGNFYDSIEETKIGNLLFKNFINYEPHKRLIEDRNWTCDFYLPDQELWVEYDGLGDNRLNISQYQEKLIYYNSNNFNWIELKPSDDVLAKCNLYLDSKSFDVRKIKFSQANTFLARAHYLGNAPKGATHYGAFIDDNLVGVVSIGRNANPREQALVINRVCWLDIVRNNKNFGSKFISRVLRKIKKSGYSGRLVTWSDPRFHSGTLYKACNFTQIPVKKYQDYCYVDHDGNEYHKSYCRVPAGESELEYAAKLGLVKLEIPQKNKWATTI